MLRTTSGIPAFGVTEYVAGRKPVIKISDLGLKDMDTAVKTVFHEIYHANQFVQTGLGGFENAAEVYGMKMLKLFLRRS